MSKPDVRENSGTMMYDWRPDLAPTIANRVLHDHAVPHKAGRARVRRAVETMLAHLGRAIRLARPEAFADYMIDSDALPSIVNHGDLNRVTVLKQMRESLASYLPELRARLARGFIQLALSRCAIRGIHHRSRRRAD